MTAALAIIAAATGARLTYIGRRCGTLDDSTHALAARALGRLLLAAAAGLALAALGG